MAGRKGRRDSTLRLTDKHHPPMGIAATLLAVASGGLFFATCVFSGKTHGQAGLVVGVAGVVSLLIAAVGFVLAWLSLHQENIRPHFPTIASITNGILVIFYMILYIWGTVL